MPVEPTLPSAAERALAAQSGMLPALWARYIPDQPAVISDSGTRSFAQLNAEVNQLLRALRARGLRSGDAIALMCGNRLELVVAIYACVRGGLSFTPVNWHFTADEAAYIVNDCGAKALIADGSLRALAEETADRCARTQVRIAIGEPVRGFETYAPLIGQYPSHDIDDPQLGMRMLYTSGTTGRPKGVLRPKATGLARSVTLNMAGYAAGSGQLHLCTGPLYHAAPLSFSLAFPISEGVGIVLMERWDAERTLQLIAQHRITHTHMVPTMFHRLLRLPAETRSRYDVSSLRYIVHGAAPCPVATKRALIDWLGPIVWEYYAATEGAGTNVSPEEWLLKPGTVGKSPGDHVLILREDGSRCDPGETGTVYLRLLPGLEFEYYKDGEKTARARRGQHYTLGDIGYLDVDNYLFLTDRSAHLIISGGVNIYPAEVEALLMTHPAVHDVAVIGVPNPEWGEEVKAVVELNPGLGARSDLADDMIAFCRSRLAHFKCPRSVDFVAELPRHENGKLYKHKLRERYREIQAT